MNRQIGASVLTQSSNGKFAAISDQLATVGIFHSTAKKDEKIGANLTLHPCGVDTPIRIC